MYVCIFVSGCARAHVYKHTYYRDVSLAQIKEETYVYLFFESKLNAMSQLLSTRKISKYN